jgi:hypothetical protein
VDRRHVEHVRTDLGELQQLLAGAGEQFGRRPAELLRPHRLFGLTQVGYNQLAAS